MTIVVFVDSKATDLEFTKIYEQIKDIDNIEVVTPKTKEQAKEEMMKDSDVLASIMGNWDDDELPLKDSFTIKVKKLEEIKDTAEQLTIFDALQEHEARNKIQEALQ